MYSKMYPLHLYFEEVMLCIYVFVFLRAIVKSVHKVKKINTGKFWAEMKYIAGYFYNYYQYLD